MRLPDWLKVKRTERTSDGVTLHLTVHRALIDDLLEQQIREREARQTTGAYQALTDAVSSAVSRCIGDDTPCELPSQPPSGFGVPEP